MPTYHVICRTCDEVTEFVCSLGEYHRNPPTFFHCGKGMERYFPPTEFRALDNALAGDRHYDGLRATDGTDISTRSKHREYMKRNGLTTVDDFKGVWAEAEKRRTEYRTTGKGGAVTRDDIARAMARHLGS